jgi:hypothetical protein
VDGRAETIDFFKEDVYERLMERTAGAARIRASTRSARRRVAPAASAPCSTTPTREVLALGKGCGSAPS